MSHTPPFPLCWPPLSHVRHPLIGVVRLLVVEVLGGHNNGIILYQQTSVQ